MTHRRVQPRPFSQYERESSTRESFESHDAAMAAVESYIRAVETLTRQSYNIPTRRFRIWTPSPDRWIVAETDRLSPQDLLVEREIEGMLRSLDLRRT